MNGYVTDRRRILVQLALAMGLLAPSALAQKPAPTPAPPPSSQPTNSSGATVPSSSQPVQPDMDFVMFLSGRVATADGTPVPHDASVEVVCNEKVRQKAYATPGGAFNMQLGPGSRNDAMLDASDDAASQRIGASKPYLGEFRRMISRSASCAPQRPVFTPIGEASWTLLLPIAT